MTWNPEALPKSKVSRPLSPISVTAPPSPSSRLSPDMGFRSKVSSPPRPSTTVPLATAGVQTMTLSVPSGVPLQAAWLALPGSPAASTKPSALLDRRCRRIAIPQPILAKRV